MSLPHFSPPSGTANRPAPVQAARETSDSAQPPVPEPPPDLIFIVRQDGIVLYVNRPLGAHGEDEVIGSPITDWIFPEQHQELRAALERVARTRRPFGLELKGIQRHAPDAVFECRLSSNGEGGATLSVTVVARDVTRFRDALRRIEHERDDLRQQLEERTADLAARPHRATAQGVADLLEAAGEAVFVLDPVSGTVADANDTACRWLRRDRDALLGQAVAGLEVEFPLTLPADFDLTLTETRDSRRPLILEGVHRRQDGSSFPVEVALATHETAAGPRVLAVVRDVKHRQHDQDALADAASRYRELRDLVDVPILATSRAGEIVEANPAAEACLGARSGGLLGRDARTILARPDDIRAFQRGMAEAGRVHELPVVITRIDGSRLDAHVSSVRHKDPRGGVQGYLWVLRPGTEAATPAPVEDEGPHPLVLLVDPDVSRRGERYDLLSRAGCVVVEASTLEEAIESPPGIRSRLAAMIVRVGDDRDGDRVGLMALRRLMPDARLVVVGEGDEAGLRGLAQRVGGAVLTEPVHPLALIQAVKPVSA